MPYGGFAEDINYGMESTKIMPSMYKYLARHFLFPKSSGNEKIHILKGVILISLYGSIPICGFLYILDIQAREIEVETAVELSDIVSMFCQILLLLWVLLKYKHIDRLCEDLSEFSSFGIPSEFQEAERKLNNLTTFFYYLGISAVVTFILGPIIESEKCEEYNRSHNLHETCGIHCPLPFMRNSTYTAVKMFYRLYQVIAAGIEMPAVGILPYLVYGVHEHIVVRLKRLKKILKFLYRGKSNQHHAVRVFVENHLHIIRLLDDVNVLTSVLLCTHVFVTSTIVTLIIRAGFHLAWRSPVTLIIHASLWIFALLLNCLGGQKVIDESTSLANEIYEGITWYDLDIPIQKDLLLIMCRTQRPLVAITGPFGHLTLPLFLLVLKGVYSFLIVSLIQESRKVNI